MGLMENFDRLEMLIAERQDHAAMKALLISIRDQVEQAEHEKTAIATHASALELELAKSNTGHREERARVATVNEQMVSDLNKQLATLKEEVTRLKAQQPNTPPQIKRDLGLGLGRQPR
jgi:predicted  nucleic acid-binding Zn-ribbon protein